MHHFGKKTYVECVLCINIHLFAKLWQNNMASSFVYNLFGINKIII